MNRKIKSQKIKMVRCLRVNTFSKFNIITITYGSRGGTTEKYFKKPKIF